MTRHSKRPRARRRHGLIREQWAEYVETVRLIRTRKRRFWDGVFQDVEARLPRSQRPFIGGTLDNLRHLHAIADYLTYRIFSRRWRLRHATWLTERLLICGAREAYDVLRKWLGTEWGGVYAEPDH